MGMEVCGHMGAADHVEDPDKDAIDGLNQSHSQPNLNMQRSDQLDTSGKNPVQRKISPIKVLVPF